MTTIRREAPTANRPYPEERAGWHVQCLQDLAAGKHAEGCECRQLLDDTGESGPWRPNACSEIARCALEMRSYTIEGGEDARDTNR